MLAIEWFDSNYIKLNQNKCHFLLPGHRHEVMFAKVGYSKIWESSSQKLLGIIIDWNLKFDECFLTQCKKNSKHQQEFTRIWVWNIEEH